jgi:hypothetical protein
MKGLTLRAVIVVLAASWAGAQVRQQGDKLAGAGAIGQAGQGSSVALSADGNTVIVGGPGDNNGAGAAWVFTRSAGVWSQQGGKLVGAGAVPGTWSMPVNQASAVALSADGNTALVGAAGDNDCTGAVWVFTRKGGLWTQQGQKLVGTGAPACAGQGYSVALSADGNTALVGGPEYAGWYDGAGGAWVFTRSDGVWTQQGGKLVVSGAAGPSTSLGSAVALSADGNTAIVGADADGDYVGAAWVFTRSAGVWTQQGSKLIGSGGVGYGRQGWDVGISADGNTAIVSGAYDNQNSGAAWMFTRSGGTWTQQGEKLVGTGGAGVDARAQIWISAALSGDGNTAIVGRRAADGETGAAWLFSHSRGVWSQVGERFAGSGAAGPAGQGMDVALSYDGSAVIVGGPGDNGGVGAAWVFTRTGTALWVPVVVNTAGLRGSEWRSDLGLLNAGPNAARVELTFHGAAGTATNTTFVPAGAQSVLDDVVGQLGASGQGALELSSDQPLRISSRTYNRASAEGVTGGHGTVGQSYPALASGEGLSAGQAAWLPHLVENAAYRTNIGMVNSGAAPAEVAVELYDGAGGLLTTYAVTLAPGQWKQETQPFRKKAGQTAMDRGYARVTVTSGSGVSAFASVVDNLTNDPTTVAMQR